MDEETQVNRAPKVSVTVPEKYFCQWLREDSKTNRLKLRYDLTKESLPYVTVLFTLVLTSIVYREALIVVVPAVVTLILHHLKKRLG
jgi:hypothetical protein